MTVRTAVWAVPPLSVPLIVDVVFVATTFEVTVKVPVVAPAATVAVAGTVAAEVLLEVRLIVRPPVGAALLTVTVPVDVWPPVTVAGLSVRLESVGAVTVKVAVTAAPPLTDTPIVDVLSAATGRLVTVKVPVVVPAGIDAVAGTVATEVVPEERLTVRPPAGAALLIVTVPVEVWPPATEVGFSVTVEIVGAVTPSVPVIVFVPVPFGLEAETVTVLSEATAAVVAVNVAVVWPPATVTEAGTVVEASPELRVTVTVPEAAVGAFSVIVPVELVPPTTEAGLNVSVLTNGGMTRSDRVEVVPLVTEM